MVDTGAGEIPIKNREKEFQAANIAEVIDIKFAAITTPTGTKLEPMTLHVVSTPRRGVNPCIMINPSVLEWLSYVIDCRFAAKQANSTHEYGFDLPELPQPLKYRRRGTSLSIACRHTDDEGRTKTHQETVTNKEVTATQFAILLQPTVGHMQAFVEEHDHKTDDGE